MPTKDELFTFRINPELLNEYRRYCQETGITASADLRQHIRAALKHRMERLLGSEE